MLKERVSAVMGQCCGSVSAVVGQCCSGSVLWVSAVWVSAVGQSVL